jgi:hypothetical protein
MCRGYSSGSMQVRILSRSCPLVPMMSVITQHSLMFASSRTAWMRCTCCTISRVTCFLVRVRSRKRSLHQRAVGYEFDAVKIFCDKNGKITKVPYRQHVPPDVTACIFWLKNRDPAHWRDAWQLEATLGRYIISDQPMSEEQWIKERATVIDVTPEKTNE